MLGRRGGFARRGAPSWWARPCSQYVVSQTFWFLKVWKGKENEATNRFMLTLNFRDLNKKQTWHTASIATLVDRSRIPQCCRADRPFPLVPHPATYPLPLLANGELYAHLQHLVDCTVYHSSWQILLGCASQSVSGSMHKSILFCPCYFYPCHTLIVCIEHRYLHDLTLNKEHLQV